METITVELVEYLQDSHEYKAVYDGQDIVVDPYVGIAWDNNRVELGNFTFKGDWYKGNTNIFLPDSELVK